MTDGSITELPIRKQPEKSVVLKPLKFKVPEKPVGQGEQNIIETVNKDGDPEQILKDIASGQTSTKTEIKETSKSAIHANAKSSPESETKSPVTSTLE